MNRSLEELTANEKSDLVKQIAKKKSGEIDTDWSEICDQFGLNINAETLRKAGVGIKLVADANMLGTAHTDLSSGYVERQKLRDLTKQVNAMYRTESRSELLREQIADAVKNLPTLSITTYTPSENEDNNRTIVLALGDFHYGADIHVEGLKGETLNEYNHRVFEQRMEKLFHETVEIIQAENVHEVHLMLVGDLIDGMLRQSQLMRLEYGIVESTIRLSEYLAFWIAELSQYAEIHVHAALGNHSEIRPLKSKNREFEEENLEKIIMWYLHSRLEDCEDIYVDEDCKKHSLINIQGFSFLILHGDGEKNIPQIAQDAINMYAEPIDFFICGHRHKEQEWPSGQTDAGNSIIVRVPSICGTDKYAQSRGYNGKPGAIAMVIERGYGRRCVYPIQL